jgi:hypothetical protein
MVENVRIRTAARRLEGVARRTPVMTSQTADALAGAKLFAELLV